MKSGADSIDSPNHFELLNYQATGNDENDHPYHKDTSIVGSDTINHHSRYKQSKQPQVVVNIFPENQHTFQKKYLSRLKKHIKKLSQRKLILPTPIMVLFSEMVLSVLIEVSNWNLIRP